MKIDKNSDIPLYMQIYNNIVEEIIDGYLIPGERLPSRRSLCSELGVAQSTVENAYQKLVTEEYIVARPQSGFFVSTEHVWDEKYQAMKSLKYNFSTNGVETSKLPFSAWSKLLRSTAGEDSTLFQHGDKSGEWCFRKSIRRMLFKLYGIKCHTDQIIIGPGAEDLIRDLFLLLARESRILLNNYYPYRVYAIAKELNIPLGFVKNGPEGIDIEELKTYKSGLLFQKPTHDLPTCVTVSEEKRLGIIDWLGENRYVIEDSTDKNYLYGKRKKTLWELSGGRNVIYLGSFSTTIAPSMKIGYIVVPDEIAERWFMQKRFYSNRVSRVEQVTLSKFIDHGHYERHVNYMRDIYHEKTKAFRRAVESCDLGKKSVISGDDAGYYCLMRSDISLNEYDANAILKRNGVKLSPLTSSLYDKEKALYPENTYVVGYGNMPISQIRDGVALWSELWSKYL